MPRKPKSHTQSDSKKRKPRKHSTISSTQPPADGSVTVTSTQELVESVIQARAAFQSATSAAESVWTREAHDIDGAVPVSLVLKDDQEPLIVMSADDFIRMAAGWSLASKEGLL